MIKNGTFTTGTASIQGIGNYYFYNINTNSLQSGYSATGFSILPNTEVLSYGVVYCGYLHDGVIWLFPLATEYKVNSLIASAIGNINALKISIVQSLPTTEIDTHTIYFVAKTGSTADVYDEYMYINNSWEKIGSTDIDLSNYLQTSDIADWAKAATKPTYTANEVGALSSNTSYVSSFNGESGVITYTPPVTSVNGQTGDITITDSDNKVAQSLSSSNLNLPILFRNNTNSTSGTTEAVRFVDSVTIQPSSGNLTATKFNNYTLAAACAKGVDSSITTGSTSTKLPTSAAVAAYVDATIPTVPSWALESTKPAYTASEVGALPSNTTYVSSFNGESGAITYTPPVTSVNGQTGAVTVVEDDKTWNGVTLELVGTSQSSGTNEYYIPGRSTTSATTAYQYKATSTPGPNYIAKYDVNTYLISTTPSANDNSTKVATTAYVDAAIPTVPSWALESTKPTYTFSELTSHPTTINDYGIIDAYTKTEVDGLVSGVLHYKGTKADTNALPASDNVLGDVWHVTADGSEWAWDGTTWQELGSSVDLSSYLQTSDIAEWAKASTKPTYTASEVGAATSEHTHGNITNTGDITTNVAIASGDRLVINDESASNINNSSITFGSSTAQYLANNGTWQNVPTTLPASDVSSWAKASIKPTYTASEVGAATSSHTHGNITNAGDITATATIASGDRLIINDESASKVINSSITFGSSTTQYLANNGTWQNTYDDTALAARVTALEQLEWATYYSGRSNPSNSQGANGDIYLQY